jgi:hypothetical protein
VTEHLPVESSVQVPSPLKVPTPVLAKLTMPVGVLLVPMSVSLTVAVQDVESFTGIVVGEHVIEVLVERLRAVTTKVPELPRWVVSPP